MRIHLLRQPASEQQVAEMLEALGDYIKLAVDIKYGIAAGGGALHADCEAILLSEGSSQEDIWELIGFLRHIRYAMKRSLTSGHDRTTDL
jgi:hypothetical protein